MKRAILIALVAVAGIHTVANARPACVVPVSKRWRMAPDGCHVVAPGGVVHLSRTVTEIDLYTVGGHHLAQTDAARPGGCRQWGFATRGGTAAAGWVTCNGDVFVYGRRPVLVYTWRG